jgi:hypothetical protein
MLLVVMQIADVKEKKMNNLKYFIKLAEIKSDEFGRAIIEDTNVLDKLQGALGHPEFLIPDVGCGNVNCTC